MAVAHFLALNEGAFDRNVRVLVGLVALALTVVGPRTGWGFLGVIPLATGLAGRCPLYAFLGMSTCPLEQAGHGKTVVSVRRREG